jgi:hypothetical protein
MQDGSPGNYQQNTVNSVKRIITIYKSRSINSPIWPADNCTLFATAKSAAFAALCRATWHSKGQTMPTRGFVRKDAALLGQGRWEKPRER